jgi:RNA recognition motif-containing protein
MGVGFVTLCAGSLHFSFETTGTIHNVFDCRSDLGTSFLAHPNSSLSNPESRTRMKNIFVGNLSFDTREQDIRTLFEGYGTVDRVSVVTDRDTGQPRGFAFVEMSNNAEGDQAIAAINGHEVGGRALNVNEARPKGEGGGGGRGGGGGGYRGGGSGGGGNRSGSGGGGFGRKSPGRY